MTSLPAASLQALPVLRESALLAGLDAASLEAILASSARLEVPDGGFFFMEGDPADRLFILLDGKVKLSQVTPDGQQVIHGYIAPGREFGLVAVLANMAYPVSAQAVGPSHALALPQAEARRLVAQAPQLALNAMAIMARQIGDYQSRIRELATQRVEQRIARALLRLARQTGRKVESGVLIDLPITRQDLAEMVGATLYTVSRTLKAWEAQGLVASKRGAILIRYPHGLVAIAEDLPPRE